MRVYIQPSQSLASIINTFLKAEDKVVELIFQPGTEILKDPENVELLQQQARLAKKELKVVTTNPEFASTLKGMKFDVELLNHNQEQSAQKDQNSQEKAQKGEFFQDIQRELKNGPDEDEFTKRYFDLEPPSGENDAEDASIRIKRKGEEDDEGETIEIKREEEKTVAAPAFLDNKEKLEQQNLGQAVAESKGKTKRSFLVKALIVIVLIVGGIGAYKMLPRASLTVFAQREKVSFAIDVIGRTEAANVDIENRILPIQLIQAQKQTSKTFNATTGGNFERKARGTITVYNKFTREQTMIPSRFQALTGQIYWSQRNIKIPAAKQVNGLLEPGTLTIEIVADKAGEDYNISCRESNPCKFTIPAWKGTENFDNIYAQSNESIAGGFTGQGFTITQDDYKSAELEVKEELLKENQSSLSEQIPAGFTLFENTLTSDVTQIESTHAVGDFSQDGAFTINGTMTVRAFVVKTGLVHELIDSITKSQISDDKIARKETITFEHSVQNFDFDKGQVLLKIQAEEELRFKLDEASLKNSLLGKSQEEVKTILEEFPHVQSAEITLWPRLIVSKIPKNPNQVEIVIE